MATDGNSSGQGGRGLGVRLLPVLIALAVAGFMAMKGCQEGPFGRHQIVGASGEQEKQLGLQAFQEVLQQSDVLPGGPVVDAVRGIAQRLIHATRSEQFLKLTDLKPVDFEWDVRVVRDKQVNAFCLPGGKIVVYTAILPVADTDEGLATVMGHEIGHALAHHGAERMAQTQIAQILVTGAGASLGDMDPQHRQEVMQALNTGAQFGILRYSRKHESEADRIGLYLMAAAGYDPNATVKFWERMAEATKGGGHQPEFLSTHPSHETRIRDLTGWIPEARPLFEAAPTKSRGERLPRQTEGRS